VRDASASGHVQERVFVVRHAFRVEEFELTLLVSGDLEVYQAPKGIVLCQTAAAAEI
jgi:hypothetical protein